MIGVEARLLPDGRRLHLHHGPIDLIMEVFDAPQMTCFDRATHRFQTLLTELVAELPDLRRPLKKGGDFTGPVARRMARAVAPFKEVFVTPMAAVAGAVADEMLATLLGADDVPKAYVNNGGDIAFHLSAKENFVCQSPAGEMRILPTDSARGVATSGWQGRSHSLGIADAVTVAAQSAAAADVAATLIANAVDLPGHPAITRRPASDLSPDSDLGARLVTTDVGHLSRADIDAALQRGQTFAQELGDRGLIHQAALSLQGQTRTVSPPAFPIQNGAFAHA